MIGYLILTILPLAILAGYFLYKLVFLPFKQKFSAKSKIASVVDGGIAKVEDYENSLIQGVENEIDVIAEKTISSIEESKMIIFNSLYKAYDICIDILKTIWHHLMHYFVLFMKFLRDTSDWVYTISRDRFVETAAKERKSVRRFWKHLKEYKKESDSEE